MKRIIRYRVFTMIILIVLIFSQASVFAKVDPPADKVAGSGTKEDPYILDMGASTSKRIVIEPKQIPFYFEVTGTGGVGGAFVVEYDVETGLVSFLLDRSVSSSDSLRDASVYVTETEEKTHKQQLGIKYRGVTEDKTSFPTYDIQEVLKYDVTDINWQVVSAMLGTGIANSDQKKISIEGSNKFENESASYRERSLALSNIGLKASYSDMARGDMYFFANNVNSAKQLEDLMVSSEYQSDVIRVSKIFSADQEFWCFKKDGFNPVTFGSKIKKNSDEIDFSIIYRFAGKSNSALNDSTDDDLTVESVIVKLLIAIGDDFLLKMLIQGLFGKELTINSLIFNTYEGTKLDFYSKNQNKITSSISSVVNYWYDVFSQLAYVLYIIILVYIGVMIIVTAGTSNQDKMKKSLGDWVVGLVIMLAVPTFVIPSLINLNNAFVKFMYSKNTEEVVSYYSFYDVADDIIGGDSSTASIEELMTKRNDISKEITSNEEEIQEKITEITTNVYEKMIKLIGPENVTGREKFYVDLWIGRSQYENYKAARESGKTHESTMNEYLSVLSRNISYAVAYDPNFSAEAGESIRNIMWSGANPSEDTKAMYSIFEELYNNEKTVSAIDQLIEVQTTDLMTVMRVYAEKYHRLVFAVVWFSLLFQLIALIFIYFKRIFVIAILITIFPLIMVFYCIDKMADGSAQTLSMWFNELISNIFIQSIHCIMYTVLVQMGLEIYKADPSNWFLFLAAMLLIVPAEKILREIFGLGGSTLGKLGGMGMKLAMGGVAVAKLAGKGFKDLAGKVKGKKDKAFVDKMNKNFAKVQRKQNRADARAAIRANKRQARGKTELSGWDKFREGVYHAATNVRAFEAKAAPKVATAAKMAKNAAATGAGVVYGIAEGGGLDGFTKGMQFADELKGKSGKMVSGKKAMIQDELSSAYKRKYKKVDPKKAKKAKK